MEEKSTSNKEMIPASNFFGFSTTINEGETVKYYFYCTVQDTYGDVAIENFATISSSDIEEIVTNKITNTIKGTNEGCNY